MDYEKEYKSLVAKVKKAHQFAQTDSTKSVLEDILPQLRESEDFDEKVRKWLVDYFSSIKETVWIHRDITCEQILDWLEKQKEQKPCEPKNWPADKDTLTQEQKPVVTHGETYRVDTLGTQQVIAGKMPQKPAEWSENEERMFEKIDGSLIGLKTYVNEHPSMSQAYKESVIKDIEQQQDWLKSLRPSWKPSEEQMEALQHAIDACESEWAYQDDELRSLLNDIKKL